MEAQRNWLSVTLHLPLQQWYTYNLEYWGLDYPPLTAYHSLILGYIAKWTGNGAVVALGGAEVEEAVVKRWMRLTVLFGEVFWWAVVVAWVKSGGQKGRRKQRDEVITPVL
jgi:alpha-1,3-glucosyltransferase